MVSFFALISAALKSGIDSFLNENVLEYSWDTMLAHPRNDILLVYIDQVLLSYLTEGSKYEQAIASRIANVFKHE